MTTLSNFEFRDKRGDKKEVPPTIALVASESKPAGDRSTWLEVKAAISPAQIQQSPHQPPALVIMGRVLGLRSDELPFIADYWLSADYDDCRDWEAQARKRLDTFLNCDCSSHSPCAVHKMYIPQWQTADMKRLALVGTKPVPRVLEVLHKAEMARAQRSQAIALPR
jgi:hypothetical protein